MSSKSLLKIIRLRNARNLIFPVILLILIIILYINSPIRDILKPFPTNRLSDISTAHRQDKKYISLTVDTLYATGLECVRNGRPVGQYYYAFEDDFCHFFLLSSKHLESCLQGSNSDASILSNVTIKAKVIRSPKHLPEIIEHLAHELSWTYDGLSGSTSAYLISEPDYLYNKTCIIFIVLLLLAAVSSLYILYSLLCIFCPYIYKSVLPLRHYGKIREHISNAGQELTENILLHEGNFIITANYLMDCSKYDFRIIPLDRIVWAYKFSSYHPSKPINRKITYTLCIYGQRGVALISPYCLKIDADRALDYLNRHYPDILFGYSKEYERIAKLRMKSK